MYVLINYKLGTSIKSVDYTGSSLRGFTAGIESVGNRILPGISE